MKTLLLAASAAALVTTGVSAQEPGDVHFGAGYTLIDADGIEFDTLTLRGGYDFTEYFGVEGDLLVGLGDENIGGADVSLDYGLGAYAKLQAPLTENFSVFGRIGYVYWDAEASGGGITLSDSDDGFAYGVGAEWAFNGPNAVRFDYTRYDFDGAESDGYGVSYVRRF